MVDTPKQRRARQRNFFKMLLVGATGLLSKIDKNYLTVDEQRLITDIDLNRRLLLNKWSESNEEIKKREIQEQDSKEVQK